MSLGKGTLGLAAIASMVFVACSGANGEAGADIGEGDSALKAVDKGCVPPPPPPPPRKCFGGGWASDPPAGVPCPDAKTLASQVEAMCKKSGYEVNSFSVGQACVAGGYDGAKFECCEPKDVPPPPPPPPPPPRKCFGGGFAVAVSPGGTPACESSATYAAKVSAICAASGFEVNSFAVGAPCPGGGFSGATYECCSPKDGTVPPPSPPTEPAPPPGK